MTKINFNRSRPGQRVIDNRYEYDEEIAKGLGPPPWTLSMTREQRQRAQQKGEIVNRARRMKKAAEEAPIKAQEAATEDRIFRFSENLVDVERLLTHEKLSPVLAMYKYKTFDEAIEKADMLIKGGGYGHTA